jgi:putative cell wall-binding protein
MLLTVTLATVGAAVPTVAQASTTVLPAAGVFEAERAVILQQTNELRASQGLPALRLNAALNDIAQDWSEQQAAAMAMSHRPNFAASYPGGWTRAAENVAAGYGASQVVAAWANSPGHRANLLSSNTDIGIGIAASSTGRLFYTQNFARYGAAPPDVPGETHRIAGADRFAASARISQRTFVDGADTVYVASGLGFADALSAAALAGAARGPLLLVTPTVIPDTIVAELRRLRPQQIIVAGGPASVSDGVVSALRSFAPEVRRISGADRFAASRNLALDAYPGGSPLVYIATGLGFADALAAGPAAASLNAPVVLVPGTASSADQATLDYLDRAGAVDIIIVGGPATITPEYAESLVAAGLRVDRISGRDRFEAAANIAARHFPNAERAYIATGLGFADALSGGAAAGALGAPLLTAPPGCVTEALYSTVSAQAPADIILLGGLASLSPTVAGFYRC